MPQIWLTYHELAALMNCDPAAARGAAAAIRLDRRKSRDGQTRAKLSASLAQVFFDGMLRQRLEKEIAACAGDLRAIHEHMAPPLAAGPEIPARNAR